MKTLAAFIISLIFAVNTYAETDFPRGTFEVADLEKAKVVATTAKKEIAFIDTSKTTTCGLCQNAAAAYISAVKSKAVIVYVDSEAHRTTSPKLPELVQQALAGGRFIPKVVVTDSAVSKVAGSLTYEAYKEDDRKAIRSLRKALMAE